MAQLLTTSASGDLKTTDNIVDINSDFTVGNVNENDVIDTSVDPRFYGIRVGRGAEDNAVILFDEDENTWNIGTELNNNRIVTEDEIVFFNEGNNIEFIDDPNQTSTKTINVVPSGTNRQFQFANNGVLDSTPNVFFDDQNSQVVVPNLSIFNGNELRFSNIGVISTNVTSQGTNGGFDGDYVAIGAHAVQLTDQASSSSTLNTVISSAWTDGELFTLDGESNTIIGEYSGENVTGDFNSIIGASSVSRQTSGGVNTNLPQAEITAGGNMLMGPFSAHGSQVNSSNNVAIGNAVFSNDYIASSQMGQFVIGGSNVAIGSFNSSLVGAENNINQNGFPTYSATTSIGTSSLFQSTANNTHVVAIGQSSGRNSTGNNRDSVFIGINAGADGNSLNRFTAIGGFSGDSGGISQPSNITNSIALGYGAIATKNKQFSVGGPAEEPGNSGITEMVVGGGPISNNPVGFTLTTTDAREPDQSQSLHGNLKGGDITLRTGRGTGTQNVSSFTIQTPSFASSEFEYQTIDDRVNIDYLRSRFEHGIHIPNRSMFIGNSSAPFPSQSIDDLLSDSNPENLRIVHTDSSTPGAFQAISYIDAVPSNNPIDSWYGGFSRSIIDADGANLETAKKFDVGMSGFNAGVELLSNSTVDLARGLRIVARNKGTGTIEALNGIDVQVRGEGPLANENDPSDGVSGKVLTMSGIRFSAFGATNGAIPPDEAIMINLRSEDVYNLSSLLDEDKWAIKDTTSLGWKNTGSLVVGGLTNEFVVNESGQITLNKEPDLNEDPSFQILVRNETTGIVEYVSGFDSGVTTTPGGTDRQIQFNNSSSFDGAPVEITQQNDIEFTQNETGIILRSASGTRFKVVATDDGNLVVLEI